MGAFTEYYGSTTLDASLLLMCSVGFLPSDDERLVRTVDAIQRELSVDGFVKRYQTGADNADGLPGHEGAFLLTTFWLADTLAFTGRTDEAAEIFDRLLALRNDVGLLAEEYDPVDQRMLGNFPQAFSHIGLIHTAANLSLEDAAPCRDPCLGSSISPGWRSLTTGPRPAAPTAGQRSPRWSATSARRRRPRRPCWTHSRTPATERTCRCDAVVPVVGLQLAPVRRQAGATLRPPPIGRPRGDPTFPCRRGVPAAGRRATVRPPPRGVRCLQPG